MFSCIEGASRGAASLPSTPDKLGLKRVVDLVRSVGAGDDDVKHMNRRLQTMLEEALTKNLHLQQVRWLSNRLLPPLFPCPTPTLPSPTLPTTLHSNLHSHFIESRVKTLKFSLS